jgi:hypothetical protein
MSTSIDSTYQAVSDRLPTKLRGSARTLLFDLGLARTPEAGWVDVFQLAPCRDLPLFALPEVLPCDARTLDAFRRAHHCACFYSVLVDRMADQQAATTPERARLAEHLLVHWRQSLAEAEGDEARALWAIDRGVRALHDGIGLERLALTRRSLSLDSYGRSILLKLGWAGIASEALLRPRLEEHRIWLFRCTFNLLASALQVVDDAEDSAEDEATRGIHFPAALGFPPASLFTASALLTKSAASAAARGGFKRFAEFLSHRASELEQIRKRRIRPADNLAGIVIASSLEAVCLSVAGSTLDSTAGISSSVSST